MERRQMAVATGLGEVVESEDLPGIKRRTMIRHASAKPQAPKAFEAVPGDRWSAPLVAARLQRIAAISRRDRSREIWPEGLRSGMPEPILDRSRDYAPATTTPRPPLSAAEIDHAVTTFQILLRLFVGDEDAPSIVWCIANRLDYEDAAHEMNAATWRRKRDWTARNIRYHWAENIGPAIVDLFEKLRLKIEPDDVALAERRSFHRKI